MKTFVLSNIGNHRERNEDSYLLDEAKKIFAVCDGMGGHKAGDVASKLAVNTVADYFGKFSRTKGKARIARHLVEAVWAANYKILNQSRQNSDLAEMGTTLTAVHIGADYLMSAAHVGDSSLYLYRSNELKRITREHTLAERMVAEGGFKREDAELNAYKHVLTRALGIDKRLKVDIIQKNLLPKDILLLCSDGLTDLVNDKAIHAILAKNAGLMEKGEQLVNEALQLGGHDNVTVLLIEIE